MQASGENWLQGSLQRELGLSGVRAGSGADQHKDAVFRDAALNLKVDNRSPKVSGNYFLPRGYHEENIDRVQVEGGKLLGASFN